VRKSFKTHSIQMTRRERKCLHHYLYLMDPEFGFMHVCIQGWIPHDCQIYINGREWLALRGDPPLTIPHIRMYGVAPAKTAHGSDDPLAGSQSVVSASAECASANRCPIGARAAPAPRTAAAASDAGQEVDHHRSGGHWQPLRRGPQRGCRWSPRRSDQT
jgi:hypothetical protein